MQTKELNNGRLAMIAVAAFTVQVCQSPSMLSLVAASESCLLTHQALAGVRSLSCFHVAACASCTDVPRLLQ